MSLIFHCKPILGIFEEALHRKQSYSQDILMKKSLMFLFLLGETANNDKLSIIISTIQRLLIINEPVVWDLYLHIFAVPTCCSH